MKKILSAALMSFVPVGILTSCGGNNKIVEENDNVTPVVELIGYSYDAIAILPDSLTIPVEGGNYTRVAGQGMLPRRVGKKDITLLRDSLERLGRVLLLDKKDTEPRLSDGMALVEIAPNDTIVCSSSNTQLTIAFMSSKMVVWKCYRYEYLCRAAHGTYNTTFVNYSIAKGKILSLEDIFKPGYEKELTDMLRAKLKNGKYDLITPLNEIGIPSDFEITENGINFVYGIYEIAPYSSGEITVEFDTYELDDLFIPDIIPLLYNIDQ